MSKRFELFLVRGMVAVLVFIVVLMPLHAFLSTWLGTSIGPLLVWKSWKELLLLAVVPIVAIYCWRHPNVARAIWARLVNKLIALYVLLHVILAIFSTASAQASLAGLLMNLRFLAVFILAQVVVEAHPAAVQKLKQWAPPWLLWTLIGLAVVAILQVTVLPKEFFTTFGYDKDSTISPYILVDENPDALRAFATLRGPNTLGSFVLLPLAIALYAAVKRQKNWLAWTALALGVITLGLTGSRSAWLGAIAMMGMLATLLLPKLLVAKWARLGILPVLLATLVVGWLSVTVPAVRLAVFHSSPGEPLLEGSSEQHWRATADGTRQIAQHPLGLGVGSAGPASFYNQQGPNISENYFVQIGQEVGVLGVGLFIAICVVVFTQLLQQRRELLPTALLAAMVGMSIINLFQHGWADDPTAIVWWALAGLFMAKSATLGKEHRQ